MNPDWDEEQKALYEALEDWTTALVQRKNDQGRAMHVDDYLAIKSTNFVLAETLYVFNN